MFAPPGAPDVLTLAQTAYNIYDAYHGAQDRYKELCDDIRGLEITLQRLGNRLATQPSNHVRSDKVGGDGDGGGQGYNEEKLDEILHITTALLGDLQRKIPAGSIPRGLYRLKWSQNEANAIRARITGISATIAAFNSSLLLDYVDSSTTSLGETQERILRTLEDVLIRLQKVDPKTRQRRLSETSALVEEIRTEIGTEKEGGRARGGDLWMDLVTEMQKHGISETQIEQHKSMILQWAGRAIAAGILNQPDDDEEMETETYWEVISAVYGPRNVTSLLQRMIDTHRQHRQRLRSEKVVITKPLQFIVMNEAFGGDPFPAHIKAFSMAWRKRIIRRYGRQSFTSYSEVQKVFAQESDVVVIDFDQPLIELDHIGGQMAKRGVEIIIANWHNLDITQHISSLVQQGQTAIMATDMQLLTHDPSPGYIKFLSVTYSYTSPADNTENQYFQVHFAEEGTELDIPPSLDILYANWGGLDITTTLLSQIEPRTQTLTLDTHRVVSIASPDPWPGFHKCIVVVYRYNTAFKRGDGDGDGMELLVVGEGMGTTCIKPYQSGIHRSRNWKLDLPFPSDDSKTKILGIIWGLQTVSTTLLSTRPELRDGILEDRRILCTNRFFGGEGWFTRIKACLVLMQNVETREIAALVGREGTLLELVSPW
ncbi:hypothetical protein TMatcc_003745 [Talaromyces marneffei ATCC 18224]|uniref:Uncharacterized protein n=2 Tax=Talaromyces marneffei TaxID=37727 RepID=B6Q268_TALMQ|nr:uncharacterized protein EYB26_001245 [Talaromyces marneffei]EEA27950.1 hypothetical protein PMAA_027860 [Talaromyces marneffei ATCC 18224]QGA13595.1 hypothetical protein EYB26_001245 [Talaromyces marneffei]